MPSTVVILFGSMLVIDLPTTVLIRVASWNCESSNLTKNTLTVSIVASGKIPKLQTFWKRLIVEENNRAPVIYLHVCGGIFDPF